MQYFKTTKPPKTLRISELCLPRNSYFTQNYAISVPEPHNSLSMRVLRNFNKFSAGQLADYKKVMIKKWGDIVLTRSYSSSSTVVYTAKYSSNYRKRLSLSGIAINESVNN